MSLANEIQKLDDLRRNGTLSEDEFEIAKRQVLAGASDAAQFDHLGEMKVQNELAQLDREWTLERENYMVSGKYGHRFIPQKVSSVFVGLFAVGFGILWIVMAASMPRFASAGPSNLFPWFGVLFILAGLGMSVWMFLRAGQYEQAQRRYQLRRRQIQNKNRDQS